MANQSQTESLASAMPLISQPALLQAYLSQQPPRRPAKRAPSDVRPIHLNTGSLTHCNGSSLVRLGESTIVCGIRAELLPVSEISHYRASETARETADKKSDDDGDQDYQAITLNNLLVPNLELSTNCHPQFPPNVPPSSTAQNISYRVLSLLHSTRLVRTSDLEIRHTSENISLELDPDDPAYVEPERDVLKAYWVLYIDCVCLSYGGEGNVFDTTVLAIIGALQDVRLPSARWDEDAKQILCNADFNRARRLQLRGRPCPLSFAVFEFDRRLQYSQAIRLNGADTEQKNQHAITLLDTDSFEDGVCEEKGNAVVDCSEGACQILRIEKVGGSGRLDIQGMNEIITAAEKRWRDWEKVLRRSNEGNG